jgi:hypothetical protein
MGRTKGDHGYGPYTQGCRCGVCREAKRVYTRQQRAYWSTLRRLAERSGRRHVVSGVTHGYSGYQNFHCRCVTCCAARVDYHQRREAGSDAS